MLQFKCGVTIESCINAYKAIISCYVINEITNDIPGSKIDTSNLTIPPNIKLANPTFYKPMKIDILIGAVYLYRTNKVRYEFTYFAKNKVRLGSFRAYWKSSSQ